MVYLLNLFYLLISYLFWRSIVRAESRYVRAGQAVGSPRYARDASGISRRVHRIPTRNHYGFVSRRNHVRGVVVSGLGHPWSRLQGWRPRPYGPRRRRGHSRPPAYSAQSAPRARRGGTRHDICKPVGPPVRGRDHRAVGLDSPQRSGQRLVCMHPHT